MKKRKYNYKNLFILIVAFILALLLLLALIFSLYHIVVKANSSSDEVVTSSSAPKAENAKKTIAIDPGHGGYDGGSASSDNSVNEKEITLAIALKAGKLLEQEGYKVIYTRNSDSVSWPNDERQDLTSRVNIAEEANADVFVSIHTNASEVDNDGSEGSEVWVMPISDFNISLANNINAEIAKLKFTTDRGVKDQSENPIQILFWNSIPAVLVELGFINDNSDFAYMTSTIGQNNLAQAIANGTIKTLNSY